MAEKPGRTPKSSADARKERLKAALRENLRRRRVPEPGNRPESGQGDNTKPASPAKT